MARKLLGVRKVSEGRVELVGKGLRLSFPGFIWVYTGRGLNGMIPVVAKA